MKHRILISVIVLFGTTPVSADFWADYEAAKKACKSDSYCLKRAWLQKNKARDKYFAEMAKERFKNWRIEDMVDPMDDSAISVIRLTASSGQNSIGKAISMTITCGIGEPRLSIHWGEVLPNKPIVTTRVGKNKAVTSQWSISADHMTSNKFNAAEFIEKMAEADDFIARVTPQGDNPITAIFKTAKTAETIKPLRAACGW